jgi:mannose-6-phosphate isomerase-like protein (cupin superfamily)
VSGGQVAVVRRMAEVSASPLGPGVTVTELLNQDQGCRGLHQRRLSVASGAQVAGTAGGRGEAWYVITGAGFLDTERAGRVALAPGTAVWLEPGHDYACLENTGPGPLQVLGVFHPAGSPAAKRES